MRFGSAAAEVAVTAASGGTLLVLASDGQSDLHGSGAYRLTPSASIDVPGTPHVSELALAPGVPNPFATRMILKYQVPRAGAAALRVFDPQGRLVRTLVNESSRPAGDYEAMWDGRDAAGTIVRPGLYLVRLDSGGRRAVQRVVLSR